MRKIITSLVITLAILFVWSITGLSEEIPPAGVDLAQFYALEGVKAYYRIYETWPSSWRSVVDEGIVQAPLNSFGGQTIDPDDGKSDFIFDLVYVTSVDGPPSFSEYVEVNGNRTMRLQTVEVPTTLNSILESAHLEIQLSNGQKSQLVTANLLNQSVMFFVLKNRRYPLSWQELLGSGVTPIDLSSINPLTGNGYTFDGSPNDFTFRQHTNEQGEIDATTINLVEPDGKPLGLFF